MSAGPKCSSLKIRPSSFIFRRNSTLCIDIGGTFTDFVLFDENNGSFHTFKHLSTLRALAGRNGVRRTVFG
ncbi:MAG TPA: hypothetical protein G4N96_05765 [Chloroflexi bacterium]|nr:hypothetical protein [Chloroflexota bacterium]